MKAIVCEMCSGKDVVKQGEYYVCQSCGTKYEPDAARKLLVEIDSSEKLDNLYSLARRAKDEDNSENAAKYYGQILEYRPDDWEAYFYSSFYTAQNTTIANMAVSAGNLAKAIPTSFRLLSETGLAQEEKESHVLEMTFACEELVLSITNVAMSQLREYLAIGSEAALGHEPEYRFNMKSCCNVLIAAGDAIEKYFILAGNDPSGFMKDAAVEVWQRAMDIVVGAESSVLENEIANRIKKYDSEYESAKLGNIPITKSQYNDLLSDIKNGNKIAAIKKVRELTGWGLTEAKEYTENVLFPAAGLPTPTAQSGGCYVATAVYGSYDCPEVWTLRRYRDYELAKTFYGRAFIRAYYAVSPRIVMLFGDAKWFKKAWRKRLDTMVNKLIKQGYENTPYSDLEW